MSQTSSPPSEQRIEKRSPIVCKVYVHGITESGKQIKIHTLTDNISQGGLFLQSPYALKLGSYIFTFTWLPSSAGLAAQGKVVRIEEKEHGFK